MRAMSKRQIEQYRDNLYERLEEGYQRITVALDKGEDAETWKKMWVALLNEYEQVCDQLQRDLAV